MPYAVKIHGSALEYTVKPHPRFLPAAREGLAPARGVLVGSRHTGESLWAALAEPGLEDKTRLGPPGVDVARFAPREPDAAAEGFERLRATLAGGAAAAAAERPPRPPRSRARRPRPPRRSASSTRGATGSCSSSAS